MSERNLPRMHAQRVRTRVKRRTRMTRVTYQTRRLIAWVVIGALGLAAGYVVARIGAKDIPIVEAR
jgi:hypothetical protein